MLPGRYLVIDPGRRSGWCSVERAAGGAMRVAEMGESDVWTREPEMVVRNARVAGCEALIYELPNLGGGVGHMPPATLLGFGKPLGVWEWLWRIHAAHHDRSVILGIPSMTWRATVIGGPQRSADEWKADALAHVRRTMPDVDGKELPDALCLAEHALSSLDVADAVGVRRLSQLGWTEPRGFWKDGRFNPA